MTPNKLEHLAAAILNQGTTEADLEKLVPSARFWDSLATDPVYQKLRVFLEQHAELDQGIPSNPFHNRNKTDAAILEGRRDLLRLIDLEIHYAKDILELNYGEESTKEDSGA